MTNPFAFRPFTFRKAATPWSVDKSALVAPTGRAAAPTEFASKRIARPGRSRAVFRDISPPLVVCDQLRDPNSDQHRSKVVRARLRARISPPGSIQVDLCVGNLDGEEDERDEEQEEDDAPGLAFGPTSAM